MALITPVVAGADLPAATVNTLRDNAFNWTVATKTASYVLVAADVGTQINMNAAGATTLTVNTGLFAAGDRVRVLNINSGVCTITAGTATVSTSGTLALAANAGGELYFISAGVCVFIPGGVASSANALVGCTALAAGTVQSLTQGVANIIALSTELFDTDNFHDNTTNNSRLTIPAGKTGKYLISVNFSQVNTGSYSILSLFKNGTIITGMGIFEAKIMRNDSNIQGASAIVTLTAADYIEIGFQSDLATGNQTIWCNFSAIFLGA